jgi:hypothetical protein
MYKYKYKYLSKYAPIDQRMMPRQAESRYRAEGHPIRAQQAVWIFQLENAGITDAKLIVSGTLGSGNPFQEETDTIPPCQSGEVQVSENVTGVITVQVWAVPYNVPPLDQFTQYGAFYIDTAAQQKATSVCYKIWPEITCEKGGTGYSNNMHVEQISCEGT